MTKDEIYEHLAEVYLGKRTGAPANKKPSVDIKFLLHLALTVAVLGSVFYGLSAFLARKSPDAQKNIIFALNNSPIRVKYNVNAPYPQVSSFSFPIPKLNASKYNNLSFSIRGLEEGYPGIIKVVLKNRKNETSYFFAKDIGLRWQRFDIPFSEFSRITDWTNLTDLAFVFEAWNTKKKKGIVLIDDICFSNEAQTYETK